MRKLDVAIGLGIDAKKSDQAVRGSVVLPQGTGKAKPEEYDRPAHVSKLVIDDLAAWIKVTRKTD